jgi:hypothetical protein
MALDNTYKCTYVNAYGGACVHQVYPPCPCPKCEHYQAITGKTLLECIEEVYPEERCVIPFHVALSENEFTRHLRRLVNTLQMYNVQCKVDFVSNALNGATIYLDKYVLVRPNHGIDNWGDHYKALHCIVMDWEVRFYHPQKAYGYSLATDMTIKDEWECDDGGC